LSYIFLTFSYTLFISNHFKIATGNINSSGSGIV
jgi:hypothetical protein